MTRARSTAFGPAGRSVRQHRRCRTGHRRRDRARAARRLAERAGAPAARRPDLSRRPRSGAAAARRNPRGTGRTRGGLPRRASRGGGRGGPARAAAPRHRTARSGPVPDPRPRTPARQAGVGGRRHRVERTARHRRGRPSQALCRARLRLGVLGRLQEPQPPLVLHAGLRQPDQGPPVRGQARGRRRLELPPERDPTGSETRSDPFSPTPEPLRPVRPRSDPFRLRRTPPGARR